MHFFTYMYHRQLDHSVIPSDSDDNLGKSAMDSLELEMEVQDVADRVTILEQLGH